MNRYFIPWLFLFVFPLNLVLTFRAHTGENFLKDRCVKLFTSWVTRGIIEGDAHMRERISKVREEERGDMDRAAITAAELLLMESSVSSQQHPYVLSYRGPLTHTGSIGPPPVPLSALLTERRWLL